VDIFVHIYLPIITKFIVICLLSTVSVALFDTQRNLQHDTE